MMYNYIGHVMLIFVLCAASAPIILCLLFILLSVADYLWLLLN